jgi:hypothetical protein
MKKNTFLMAAILMLSVTSIQAQLAEAQINAGTSTIKSGAGAGNIALEGASSNIELTATSTELFTFTKTGATYATTIEGNAATVAVWTIQTASDNYLQLANLTSSSTRLKHRGTTENNTWYILEGNDGGVPYYVFKTAHTNHPEGEKNIVATNSNDFLNTQTVTNTANTNTFFILSGLTRTGPLLSTNDFDTSSIFISNPIDSQMIIKGLDNKVNKIEVFNLVGKSVFEKDAKGASSLQIDTNALTSGLYLVKFYGETSTLTKKIIKK